MSPAKSITVHSFAKINLGLAIGPPGYRQDGYHELRTVYQTVAMHDKLRVAVEPGSGIEIRCDDPRVPRDATNTCHKAAALVVEATKARAKVVITIEKHLPVQGGLGAASGNAASVILALEKVLQKPLDPAHQFEIAAKVGSDVPLFLVGGTVLGIGRGEQVLPMPDLPPIHMVIATPAIGISTPQAFRDWDNLFASDDCRAELSPGERSGTTPSNEFSRQNKEENRVHASSNKGGMGWQKNGQKEVAKGGVKLTVAGQSATLDMFSRKVATWLMCGSTASSGVPARGGDRAETLLLDLVRTGIGNDFEHVVFHPFPALRDIKERMLRLRAKYASLSGSGSAVYGLFATAAQAQKAATALRKAGIPAEATVTLTRPQYWRKIWKS